MHLAPAVDTIPCPDPAIQRLMTDAIAEIAKYQNRLAREPAEPAHVQLGGMRHALIPAATIAQDLPAALARSDAPEVVALVLYELGSLMGSAHAKHFFELHPIPKSEALHRVLTGPPHYAWAGYGDVDLLIVDQECTTDAVFLWESSNSFSVPTTSGRRARCCHMQAGYASGWTSTALEMPMYGHELACRAEGADRCRFVMSHEARSGEVMRDARLHRPRSAYPILRAYAQSPDEDHWTTGTEWRPSP
ncbi:MAG: narR2 [Conexibacter sp.]|nr:narR2 [Conexibacter sp.]